MSDPGIELGDGVKFRVRCFVVRVRVRVRVRPALPVGRRARHRT